MADVAIIHAADKTTAAARLADAVAAAGYAVGAVEVDDPAGLADAVESSGADARILIWSRALVSHALHSGDLAGIRQLRGLIEVSADGIAPPTRGDDTRVVSISGWRGQPFHPGWQRIHLELKRLCGGRKTIPEAPASPPAAKSAPPQRSAPADPPAAARPQALRLALAGGAAVLLVAAAVGAADWIGRDMPDPAPRQEFPEPGGAAAIAGAGRPGADTVPEAARAVATAPPVSGPSPSPEPAVVSKPKPAPPLAEADVRTAQRRPASRPERRPVPRAAPVKKYSRKNSKVMREFCARSGRSTPQCRTFLRSLRDARTAD
ncbi:MAG TPA: hypothetical protein VF650_01645 [Allosphingosinicella sp.]